jgi:hypothetical protein
LRHFTSQPDTLVHVTWQLPVHWTSQPETLVHVMVLPSPACTAQLETLAQLYAQRSPQMASQREVLWQSRLQSLPQDAVHVGTSWQVAEHRSLQTVPQVLPMPWQSCEQPSPVQPRKHSSPPLQVHDWPGSQPSVVWHPDTTSATPSTMPAQAAEKEPATSPIVALRARRGSGFRRARHLSDEARAPHVSAG